MGLPISVTVEYGRQSSLTKSWRIIEGIVKMKFLKSILSIMAVIVMAASCGGTSTPVPSNGGEGSATVNISGLNAGDITQVTVTVTGPGITSAIVANLTVSGTMASGSVSGIPTGLARQFTIRAFVGNDEVCSGSATTNILDGETASISLVLQCSEDTGDVDFDIGFNFRPQIHSLVATVSDLGARKDTDLLLAATDPDGDPLTYAWTATGGMLNAPDSADNVWTAPDEAGSYTINVEVDDGRGGIRQISTEITVYARPADSDPLSAVIAARLVDSGNTGAMNIADYAKGRVSQVANNNLEMGATFPLPNLPIDDSDHALEGLDQNVVVRWLDPLTFDTSIDGPRFGSHADYISFLGDGWDADWIGGAVASAPQWNGAANSGWLWVNHEYISGSIPLVGSAPDDYNLTLARFLEDFGVFGFDVTQNAAWDQPAVDEYVRQHKRQLGGSLIRIWYNSVTDRWQVDRSANNRRFDSTSDTLIKIEGHTPLSTDTDDAGTPLPMGVVPGIAGDCSGATTPWGTILTAEENVQGYYGDLETAWSSNQQFIPGVGFDPGLNVSFTNAPSANSAFGVSSVTAEKHLRESYGWLVEIDPSTDPDDYYESVNSAGDGVGHRKIGPMGRARWENATFVTDTNWKLIDGQPVVIYAANDRRSGRVYKFVSSSNYSDGMTRGQVRALLDSGTLYVAHFADMDTATGLTLFGGSTPTEGTRGNGQWIEMSVSNNLQEVPNDDALGDMGVTVGAALQDVNWNGIGGFPNDNDVRRALFTAAMKIGVRELNRPEDVEWNPRDPSGTPRLYIAFTNHTRPPALNQGGVLTASQPARTDAVGAVYVLEEANAADPGASMSFTFWSAWNATAGNGEMDAANPDNILIDADGGVWFGTDGNPGDSGGYPDAFYYLDLDPTHQGTPVNTFGQIFRVTRMPSNAENTGPAFNPDMTTLFTAVQHPGEGSDPSTWPQDR